MLISNKQHQANRQNAQHSTGPVSPEGKAAVRLNALTFGLRARCVVLIHEDEAAYQQLCDVLESEWQPQAPTEKILLERMAVAHWLLMRTDCIEERIFTATKRAQDNSPCSIASRPSAPAWSALSAPPCAN